MGDSRRILFVHASPGIPVGGHGGGSRHLREVVGAMARAGHEVLLVARRGVRAAGDPFPDLPARVELLPQGTLPGSLRRVPQIDEAVYDRRLAGALKKLASGFGPSLVYERFSLFSTAGVQLARQRSIPSVLEVNAPLVQERQRHEQLSVGPFTRRREKRILNDATRLVVVSSALRRYALDAGVPGDRVRVLPNGVDVERFHPDVKPIGGRDDGPLVGFCGTLKPWHDLVVVLEAVARTPGLERVQLLVVGDGPGRTDLVRKAEQIGVGHRVIWAGARHESEVPGLLAACDVLCVPAPVGGSHYFSPLKLLEGMALGLPVVATDAGDVAAIAGGNDPAALLVEPGDHAAMGAALARVLRDEDLRQQLGRAGRARALRHTWDDVVRASLEGL